MVDYIPIGGIQRPTRDKKMPAYSTVRSTTGKLHLSLGSRTAMCNGRSGKFSWVHPASVDRAPESVFCEKCFGATPKTMIANMRASDSLE
jgi:hypothetical protein